ncbi:MAG: alpha-1,2-fucosyltransferase [Bacteroidetes bacterium]|nr:alpha-1,2-fucosyltransferase [Bacteroidota bacterium]
MFTCELMGGLGNQIFQIFTTMSCSITNNTAICFVGSAYSSGFPPGCKPRHTYWDSFFEKLKPFLVNVIPNMKSLIIIKEKQFSFKEIECYTNKNYLLHGYFQSYKYFDKNYKIISEVIELEKMKNNVLKELNMNADELKTCVSLHFRLGDYKNLQNHHPLMPKEYYINSLNFIKRKTNEVDNVLYFCENQDNDEVLQIIKLLEKKFADLKFVRGNNKLQDWQQMLLMSCCHYNIIANSTFSWWGAYFNSWSDKVVCYPSVWFGKAIQQNDTKDLFPPEWNKINVT